MKRFLTVILTIVLAIGLLTICVFADNEENPQYINVDFSVMYLRSFFEQDAYGNGRLTVSYYPKTVNGPFTTRTVLKRDLDEVNVFASVTARIPGGTEYTASSTTPSSVTVIAYLEGPAYVDPIRILHVGIRDIYDVFSYGVIAY